MGQYSHGRGATANSRSSRGLFSGRWLIAVAVYSVAEINLWAIPPRILDPRMKSGRCKNGIPKSKGTLPMPQTRSEKFRGTGTVGLTGRPNADPCARDRFLDISRGETTVCGRKRVGKSGTR